MADAVRDKTTAPPSKAERQRWTEVLDRELETLPPSMSEWLQQAPRHEREYRSAWERTSGVDRARVRKIWAAELDRFSTQYPRLANAVFGVAPIVPNTRDSGGPIMKTPLGSALASYVDDQQAKLIEAEAIDPKLALEMRALMDQQNEQFFSKMADKIHDMNMGINRNITY